MPAFSHCFLKRFMAFSNDSPSLTRTPGILGITTLRGAHNYPGFGGAGVYARVEGCQRFEKVPAPPWISGPVPAAGAAGETLGGAGLGLGRDGDRPAGVAPGGSSMGAATAPRDTAQTVV